MDLYFGGTEQKMWRELLAGQGVEHVSLSYIGLRRRIKDPRDWRIADHYPGQKVFLDSGAFTLNKTDETQQDEAWELAQSYMDFVDANIDSIEFASEFDASVLGQGLIWNMRATYWQQLPDDKWMPVWHSETGARELERLAATYARVGVLQGDSGNGDISALLRRLAGSTRLHGVAMTKMDAMEQVPWSSVGSTSWLSPTQYGDTFVWTGRELKRYPKKYKEQARKRHRTWLADQGFDMDLIESDDNGELLRLSIWSWQHYAASIKSNRGVTTSAMDPHSPKEEPAPEVVDTPGGPMGNGELLPRAGKKLLPVLGVTFERGTDKDGNETEVPHLSTPNSGLLACNNCFLREKCPESTPGSDCVYEIPAKVRTASQLAAVQDWLIETQIQRVAFMRLVEQHEGGYSDTNTTTEMLHLTRMIKAKQEAAREGFSLKIEASGTPGGPGMISRIFGSDVTDKMGALPAAVDAKDVWEAEVLEEKRSN
jgi:hypothetical protein